MKQTQIDRAYALKFGRRLTPHYSRAVPARMSAAAFARLLGVTSGGLKKYLAGTSMPSLLTIVKAYREFRIAIPYDGFHVVPAVRASKSKQSGTEFQMSLPFSISSPGAQMDLLIKKKDVSSCRFELRVKKAL